MSLSLLSRYAVFVGCVLFTLASLPFLYHEWLWPFTLTTAFLSLIGILDLLQSPHSVRRNYPILGNIRAEPGCEDGATSPMTPARAASAPTIGRTAAI